MEQIPLPPLEYATYVFANFAQIYYTQNKPISLAPQVPEIDPVLTYVSGSKADTSILI